MANVPANVILIWVGTNASIPSGWSRETTLDDKYAKAWGSEDPDETGGAATHTHTSSTHTHSISSHTHTGTASASSGTTEKDTAAVGGCPEPAHTHTFTSGGTSGTSSASSAITWSSASNDPAYRKVIFIKSSGGSLATDIVALYNSNTPPSNWSNVTELADRFLKGAGTGADADISTDNGSDTHTHTSSHTHTFSHNHTGTTGAPSNQNTKGRTPGGANTASVDSHTHTFTLSTKNETSDTYNATTDSQNNIPEYAILQAIKKGATGNLEIGIIGLWLGTAASIPTGWILCDGNNGTKDLTDKFIRIGNPEGANGGSNTNSHGTTAHTHNASAAHTHTATTAQNSGNGYYNHSGGGSGILTHTHPISSTSSKTTALASGNIPATSTDSNEPEYRTAVYIELNSITSEGGAFLYNLL